ncbi:hypothetical protein PHYC_03709 [Phycisphaerales bacterium]|nr:hypothetical protein PHYC_03709 [Phycisphaerales bacterium]
MLAGFLAATAAAQDITLTLRGGDPVLVGGIEKADIDGLVFNAGSARRVVPWNRVAAVSGEGAVDAALLDIAGRAWRGCSRVERGDYAGAEPILEGIINSYAGRVGPTGADVSWALLKCRLSRGAYVQAVPVMLAYAGSISEGRGDWLESAASRREPSQDEIPDGQLWDDSLGLCPMLPPMWLDLPATQALARRDWTRSPGRADYLSAVYAASVRFESGLEATLPERPTIDEGGSLVFDVVAARVGDGDTRKRARAALADRLRKSPAEWIEVWCRAGLGRSLIREQDAESQLLGVAELLRVPALHERYNPYVSGLCLAEAAVALHRLGEREAGVSLRTELGERFPGHPAQAWDALERVESRTRVRPQSAAPPEPADKPDEPSPSPGGPP